MSLSSLIHSRAARVTLVSGLVGLFGAAVIAYSLQIGIHSSTRHAPLLIAITKLRLDLTTSYLQMQDVLTHNRLIYINTIQASLESAELNAQKIIQIDSANGDSPHSLISAEFRDTTLELKTGLGAFAQMTQSLLARQKVDSLHPVATDSYERDYRQLLDLIGDIERHINDFIDQQLKKFRLLQLLFGTAFLLLTILTGWLVYRMDKQRTTDFLRLQKRDAELKETIDGLVDGLITIDEKGIILTFNRSAEAMFGYSADEIVGQSVNTLIPEPHHSRHDGYLARYLETGEGKVIGTGVEVEALRRTGETFPMQLSVSELPPASTGRRRFVGSCLDISEHHRMEQALNHAQKLEAIGQMAGGIAHDFNNILGIIMGNLEILKRLSKDRPELEKWIETGLKTTKRGSALTSRLLGFTRQKAKEVKSVLVSDIINDMRPMIDKSLTHSIEVRYELTRDIWPVSIDPGDFEDAVINLVINARDALQHHGQVTIAAFNCTGKDINRLLAPQQADGDHVCITITDNGPGIPPQDLQRIFEPFYTTKEPGQGTGLGLSMVHGFIRRSNGHIHIESTLGKGAIFYLYLPRSHDLPETAAGASDDADLPHGDETVLVVDDEEQLVEIAVTNLRSLGYQTLSAYNAEQAMEILQGSQTVDLLFTDIIMPHTDGYELAAWALHLLPDLKILLASGFTKSQPAVAEAQNAAMARLQANLLHKPYNKQQLAIRIRQALDNDKNATV